MKLTVVGCSGSFPGPESAASCYLVEADGYRVVLDLGSGAIGELQRYVGIYDVDAVLITHLHPDHYIDLCGYYVARKYRPGGPAPRIPVYGPEETARRTALAYDLPVESGMSDEFSFAAYGSEPFDLGPFRVATEMMNHPVAAYGIRLEHRGRVVAYSGDTGTCDALQRLAKGADLFLCEASFHEGRDTAPDLHLNGREAGEAAREAGAQQLVLTHIPPWNDPARTLAEAAKAYEGPTELARPGLTYHLWPPHS